MMPALLQGVYVPLITPFAADGAVALDALDALAHEYLERVPPAWSCWRPPASRRRSMPPSSTRSSTCVRGSARSVAPS